MKKGKTLMRRIGMLTSGGDCQSLNATMRGVAKSLYKMFDDIEIVGFEDGYKGLMYADYRIMKQSDFSGILTRGGTILGTSRQPFKLMRTPDENGLDKVEAMYREWNTLPGIVMRGMHCYDGHRHESSVQEREVATAPVDKQIEEIKARGGKIIAVIARGDEQVRRSADFVIEVPVIAECLMPIVVSVPLQLLAYYIAVYKGRNVDQPRNLAKSVTVE